MRLILGAGGTAPKTTFVFFFFSTKVGVGGASYRLPLPPCVRTERNASMAVVCPRLAFSQMFRSRRKPVESCAGFRLLIGVLTRDCVLAGFISVGYISVGYSVWKYSDDSNLTLFLLDFSGILSIGNLPCYWCSPLNAKLRTELE